MNIKHGDQVRIVGENFPNVIGHITFVEDDMVGVLVPVHFSSLEFTEFVVSPNEVVKVVKDGDKSSKNHKLAFGDDVIC